MSDASLFLGKKSARRLAVALAGTFKIEGISYARLYALRHATTHFVTIPELTHISDALFPLSISRVVMDEDFHIKEVAS